MNNAISLLGVILAGGQSRRMGNIDKHSVSFGGKTLIKHISERFLPQVNNLIINANNKDQFEGYKVVPDWESSLGPISGIYASLNYAREKGFQKIVTIPCDTPFIPTDFVVRLLQLQDNPCVVASSGGQLHPVLALWDISIINDVKASIEKEEYKLMNLIKKLNYVECEWTEKRDPFFNINTPADIKIAETRIIS